MLDTFTQFDIERAAEWLKEKVENAPAFDYDDDVELTRWMKLDRELTDIDQLYRVFIWDMDQLYYGIDITLAGKINSLNYAGKEEDVLIVANGYTMNAISAGINFIEALRSFSRHEKKHGFERADDFEEMVKGIHENSFSYNLFSQLRNFSQHGQLIVSSYSDNEKNEYLCFDLFQLQNPALFTAGGKFKKRVQEAIDAIRQVEDGPIRLSFSLTIIDFVDIIHDVYISFFDAASGFVENCIDDTMAKLECNQERVFHNPEGEQCVFLQEGANMHILNGNPQELKKAYINRRHSAEANSEKAKAHRNTVWSVGHNTKKI